MRYVDANIILRVMFNEHEHPKYSYCCASMSRSCYVCPEVMLEIVANYLARYRRAQAYEASIVRGETDLFLKSPKTYSAFVAPAPGWHKRAYRSFQEDLNDLLSEYPIMLYDHTLVTRALNIAVDTGYDWADCILIASYSLGKCEVISIDEHVQKGMSKYAPLPEEEVIPAFCTDAPVDTSTRSSFSKMNLEHPRDNTEK